jgi:O-antigen ligase
MLSSFPSYIRAYILVVIALTLGYFHIKRMYHEKVFSKWITLWAIFSTVAFLSGNIWFLILAIAGICLYKIPKIGTVRIQYYLALLPTLPALPYEIPGFFGIRFIFLATYHRLLSIFILLPIFIGIYKKTINVNNYIRNKPGIIGSPADTFMIFYVLWLCLLTLRDPSLTSSIRGVFIIFIDMLVPYFMVSRCIRSLKEFYFVFAALLFSAVLLSYVGLIEEITRWKFYNRLPKQLGLDSFGVSRYRSRGGFLRITTTASNPISFGYFMVLALGALLYVNTIKKFKRSIFLYTFILFTVILFFTASRGAYLSSIVLIITYLYIKKVKYIKVLVGLAGIGALLFMFINPSSDISSLDKHGTFEYRSRLITNSMVVIQKNLLFGSSDFMKNDSMEEMRQGEDIIDVVNTYLQIILQYGIVGLSLFSSVFILNLKGTFNLIRKFRRKGEKQVELLGITIFSMLVATMVMIGTTSSIDIIPIYYWVVLGISSAYIRVSRA